MSEKLRKKDQPSPSPNLTDVEMEYCTPEIVEALLPENFIYAECSDGIDFYCIENGIVKHYSNLKYDDEATRLFLKKVIDWTGSHYSRDSDGSLLVDTIQYIGASMAGSLYFNKTATFSFFNPWGDVIGKPLATRLIYNYNGVDYRIQVGGPRFIELLYQFNS